MGPLRRWCATLSQRIYYSIAAYLLFKCTIGIIQELYGETAHTYIGNYIKFCVLLTTNVSIFAVSMITLLGEAELISRCIKFILEYTIILYIIFILDGL